MTDDSTLTEIRILLAQLDAYAANQAVILRDLQARLEGLDK